ncbi:MAG TPA: Type 1 glutamine amidotransferase-like domain-containing protein [Actinomycetota bacterium]|nr:Type 1 glutamine amidotransferase-like domain-containing protein [Actinomycetota bacterium]
MAGVIGLFGSGEFLPWAMPVDEALLEAAAHRAGAPPAGSPPRVLILPTASAPEGDAVFHRWGTMGLEHYRRLGAAPEVVALKVRDDAERPELLATVAGASLIYFSGGNPAYLVRTLKGTAFWSAVERSVAAGCSLGGASAGIAFLGTKTFDPSSRPDGTRAGSERAWIDAMGFFAKAIFGPHWDAIDRWRPGATAAMLAAVPEGCTFVGIDEDTALVGDGRQWVVRGRGSVTIRPAGAAVTVFGAGEQVALDLGDPPRP